MKKTIGLIALAVMLFLGGQALAQTRSAFFLGASIPLKDYAEFDGFNKFALTSTNVDDNDAAAGIGANVGFKWYFNVGVKGLGVMLSADGFYNGPNADLKTAYRERESNYDGQFIDGSFKYNTKPQYFNVPIMLGLNYIYHVNPSFGIYAEAGVGGNMRFITKTETLEQGSLLDQVSLFNYRVITTQCYEMGFGFAYQAGIGIEVARNFVIGCSFYDLGKTKVKGEGTTFTRTTIGDNTSTKTENSYNTFGTVHPMMILGRIAFCF